MKQIIPQLTLDGEKAEIENPNDVVFTPDNIAKQIIQVFKPNGSVLEPAKGKGAFLKYLPGADWCEIKEGRDFFQYHKHVNWIITNPPYSTFNQFLKHSFELADNVVFLVPVAKVLKSWEIINTIREYGGIKAIWLIPANKCGFFFGFPAAAVYFKKGWKGSTDIMYYDDINKEGSE